MDYQFTVEPTRGIKVVMTSLSSVWCMTYGEVHAAQKLEFFFSLFLASWCTSILNLWLDLKYENSVLRWYFDTKISRCHDVLWIYGYGVKVAKPKI